MGSKGPKACRDRHRTGPRPRGNPRPPLFGGQKGPPVAWRGSVLGPIIWEGSDVLAVAPADRNQENPGGLGLPSGGYRERIAGGRNAPAKSWRRRNAWNVDR